MDSCTFDTLFSKNVPHILEKIFLSLDYKSYKMCLEVSNVWNNLLTSKSFQKKAKSVFHTEILKDGVFLYEAAKYGNKVKAQKLLSIGMIDVNIAVSCQSWTPLIVAAYNGHKDIAQLLFDSGADLNKADKFGLTPLHQAASKGEIDTVRLLIDLGAEPQLTKVVATSEYVHSTQKLHRHYVITQVLLQAGADPNTTDMNGESPLLVAVVMGRKDVVQLLLQGGAKPNMEDHYGNTPLYWASCLGHKHVVKQLIDGGAQPNRTNIWGRTPLHGAVVSGKKEVVKLLLDMGADKTIGDERGRTPLFLACQKDDMDIVDVLTD